MQRVCGYCGWPPLAGLLRRWFLLWGFLPEWVWRERPFRDFNDCLHRALEALPRFRAFDHFQVWLHGFIRLLPKRDIGPPDCVIVIMSLNPDRQYEMNIIQSLIIFRW